MHSKGGTCKNFDRDARLIFLGLEFTIISLFRVSLDWHYFFEGRGVEKLAVIFWIH